MTKVEKAIIETLAYFDLSQRPLTLEEIWHFLYQNDASKLQVLLGLQKLEKRGKIEQKDNFYYLAGRERMMKVYSEKQSFFDERLKKVNRYVRFLKFVPFIQNISVTGSLVSGSLNEESDINLVMIAKKNRYWLARVFVIAILEAFGQNKNKWYRANKFSLDLVLDGGRLNLYDNHFKKEIDTAYWLANLKPVLDRGGYQKLIAENEWLLLELPNWSMADLSDAAILPRKTTRVEKFILGDLGQAFLAFLNKIKLPVVGRFFKIQSQVPNLAQIQQVKNLHRKENLARWRDMVGRIVR